MGADVGRRQVNLKCVIHGIKSRGDKIRMVCTHTCSTVHGLRQTRLSARFIGDTSVFIVSYVGLSDRMP